MCLRYKEHLAQCSKSVAIEQVRGGASKHGFVKLFDTKLRS